MQMLSDPAFAAVVGLGSLRANHIATMRSRSRQLIGYGVLLAIGLAGLLGGLYVAWFDASMSPSNVRGLSGLLFLMGGLFALGGAIPLFQFWLKRDVGAALYERGFAYKDAQGVHQVRWEDIEAVWQNITRHYVNGIPTGTTYVYTVQTKDHTKYLLDKYLADVQKLGTEVQRCTSAELGPRYWQAIQGGQTLQFGPLAISQQGITAGAKSLKWSELKAIRIRAGVISVKRDKGWFDWTRVTVPQIPNFFVFIALAQRYVTIE